MVTPTPSTSVNTDRTLAYPRYRRRPPGATVGSAIRSLGETNHHAFENVISLGIHSTNNIVWRLRVDAQQDNN